MSKKPREDQKLSSVIYEDIFVGMLLNVLRVFMSVGRHFIQFHLISYISSPMDDFYMQMIIKRIIFWFTEHSIENLLDIWS